MSRTRLILTCGLLGAGKTTLARQLAANRSAVRLTKDEWLWALGASPWDAPTNEKVERELWRIAREILGLGVSVVLDLGLWAWAERDEMRTGLAAWGSASKCTTSTRRWTNSGAAYRPGTRSHHGTPNRSSARTSSNGPRPFRNPTLRSWSCSILRHTQTESTERARGSADLALVVHATVNALAGHCASHESRLPPDDGARLHDVELDAVHERVVVDRARVRGAARSDSRSFSPDRRTSAGVTLENGTISIESISMRTVPVAYCPPTLTCGRCQSRNDKVMRPEATPSRNSRLNCIDRSLRNARGSPAVS